jgi:hypothetical protein
MTNVYSAATGKYLGYVIGGYDEALEKFGKGILTCPAY